MGVSAAKVAGCGGHRRGGMAKGARHVLWGMSMPCQEGANKPRHAFVHRGARTRQAGILHIEF